MNINESREDYLETILILFNKNGAVRSIDIANELNYSKPSVSRAVGILKANGYIYVEENGYINLTKKGAQKAKEVYERHTIIRGFLEDILGVNEVTAERDACKIEHVLSDETYLRLKLFTQENSEYLSSNKEE